ncbi:MAG: enoyl-CoA hydratase-related protein [Alphaproteobacteria bacterium]
MGKTYETLLVDEIEPHLLKVTLNRPAFANALNTQMGRDMLDLWLGLVLDPGDTRCIVLTGSGTKAFCAGGDLKERNGMTDEAWQKQHAIFEQAVYRMMDCPVPVIAAVNGAAYAGGLEFVLAADFAYAVRAARFALTEVTLGIMPGAGGTQTLPRAVGVRRAKEIILTGTPFGAEEAHDWGIVNKLCDEATLMDDVLATARRIAQNAPISVRQAKRSIDVSTQVDLKNGLAFEIEAYNRMVPTADRQEGIRAFNEKRRPVYTGR